MIKHLFLQGAIQQGKSTLLRQELEPYKKQLGGFSSQRLTWSKDEFPAGYRIVPADNFNIEKEFDPTLTNIFLQRSLTGAKKNPEVFKNYGVKLLEESQNKKIILLDEIGGSELLVPEFREKLYQLLDGNIPCIGVIKLNEKAKYMASRNKYPKELIELNTQLSYDITHKFNGQIFSFDRDERSYINAKNSISSFLKQYL